MNVKGYVLLNLVLISCIAGIILAIPYFKQSNATRFNSLQFPTSVLLGVKVQDAQGNIINEFWKANDLYLWNFANYTAAVIGSQTYYFDVKADNGVSHRICGEYSNGADAGFSTFTPVLSSNVVIQVGNGSTAASISDYKMASSATWFDEKAISSPSTTWSGNKANITMSATFSYVTAQSVSEAGLGVNNYYYTASICAIPPSTDGNTMLFMRDTFATQNVPGGGSITITYVMRLNE